MLQYTNLNIRVILHNPNCNQQVLIIFHCQKIKNIITNHWGFFIHKFQYNYLILYYLSLREYNVDSQEKQTQENLHVHNYWYKFCIDFSTDPVGSKPRPIPEIEIGNKMLQDMGWIPGSSLGTEGSGIRMPVLTYRRPNRQGLGSNTHPYIRNMDP